MSRGEVVAVIPARGGSKGVPGKNLRRVGGIPLVARAVAAARDASRVDRVVVSTDDAEIAAVAREWGAEVVDRPADLSGDTASSESALLHALDVLGGHGIEAGILVFLQATSPFIDAADLDDAIGRVAEGPEDVVFSAAQAWGFLWRHGAEGMTGVNHDPAARPRRQDREPEYLETGAFYVLDAAGFRVARHRFFGRTGVAVVEERHALEIDTEEQLRIATAIAPLVSSGATLDVDALVTDFDGVHTDDSVLVGQDGAEFVTVDRGDGMGVALLRKAGVPTLILSTETNPVVGARAAKLGVEVRQGLGDKASVLRAWAAEHGFSLDRIAYLGNDVNDLPCLDLVGWPLAVPDAHPRVLAAARVVLGSPGGRGAVREAAERILAARERADQKTTANTRRTP
ncbi:cytidylyltransferase domain-containing protein [Pseudolysinimonas sp.]|jgi:YrbI family 3-deoxy-D-manno-octulosonate 8-phosphate phosphatase|uniref:cytidylyltransferase domain-containing protein n=1 Tax=Pseudolysinimonas sp. TaxID=2680009 RepID=UPI003784A45D